MDDPLLFSAKSIGVATALPFLLAMGLYFRKGVVRPTIGAAWSVLAVATVLIHFSLVITATSTPASLLLAGTACFLLAHGLFWTAVASHGRQRPSVVFGATVPERLVVSGPYKVVRHPFYLAYTVGLFGSTCVGDHWLQLVTAVGLFLCYNYAAAKEERLLLSNPSDLGASYSRYISRTWRWLPFIW